MVSQPSVNIKEILEQVVSTKPLVYHMTNMVAMAEQAHLTLAIGASPVMSLSSEEAAEMVNIANAVLINIGTPSKEANEAMLTAAHTAKRLGKPAILDPVGYGATKLRINLVEGLLETGAFSIVKGNGGEISLLAGERAEVRGVDSVGSPPAAIAAKTVAQKYNCIAALRALKIMFQMVKGSMSLEAAMNGLPEFQGRVAGLVRLWRLACQ